MFLQVYPRFAPMTPFTGPIWRQQVAEEVTFQCAMLPWNGDGSLLARREGGVQSVASPLFRLVGQVEGCPSLESVEGWLDSAVAWWLLQQPHHRPDPVLRYSLFGGLLHLCADRFPKVWKALRQLPLLPLCDGSWMNFEALRGWDQVFTAEIAAERKLPGWFEGRPLLHVAGQYRSIRQLAHCRLIPLEELLASDDRMESWRRTFLDPPAPEAPAAAGDEDAGKEDACDEDFCRRWFLTRSDDDTIYFRLAPEEAESTRVVVVATIRWEYKSATSGRPITEPELQACIWRALPQVLACMKTYAGLAQLEERIVESIGNRA